MKSMVKIVFASLSFLIMSCNAVEDILRQKEIFRPAFGYSKIIDYRPNYGGSSFKKNNIPNLFEALYYASPTLSHADFPDKPAIGDDYTPQKKRENALIRNHLTGVGLQAEQDALTMIRQLDDPNALVTEEHWDRMSALGYAVATGRAKIVEAMLARGIDKKLLNERMGSGRTPLSLAVWRLSGHRSADSIKIITMLVHAGANPHIASRWDGTPLKMLQKMIDRKKENIRANEQSIQSDYALINKMKDDDIRTRLGYASFSPQVAAQKHKQAVEQWIADDQQELAEYEKIKTLFTSSIPDRSPASASSGPATGTTHSSKPVKSEIQKKLRALQKSITTLKAKLQKLTKDLETLKKNL